MSSHFISLHDLRYHSASDGSGAPLLLLHGFTGSAANWQAHVAALAERWRVIRPDLPGHGQTPAPAADRCTMERVAADMALLIEQVAGAPAALLGYSMGGRLALYTALHHPAWVRVLILESASPGLASAADRAARRASDDALAQHILDEGIPAFVDAWERLPLFAGHARLPAHDQAVQRAARLANNAQGLAHSLRGMGTGSQPSLWERLETCTLPVLLISGADDAKFTQIARQMASALPHAQHVTIAQAGHTPHLEQPDAFRAAVTRFLERIGGQPQRNR
ncbi:MAG: 2-succinyl-6-hydroxy-2,4-cyclohexadiene-1-carboxylate synthase [Anaerolineae bacterium]|nr:2-succinyl-6-hydroxy-2,4-cyclohexadiene-1-carboxylate synthase [Anaerolineae bacterium]